MAPGVQNGRFSNVWNIIREPVLVPPSAFEHLELKLGTMCHFFLRARSCVSMSPPNTSMDRFQNGEPAQFQESDSDTSDYMPLPLVVANDKAVRQQGFSVASEAPRRRMQRVERSSTHLEALAAHIHMLQEQKDNLEKQLAYQIKIDSTRRAFFEEVRSASERLQSAVQKFRLDEKEIDQEFIQASSF
jgi:hypothetical protein